MTRSYLVVYEKGTNNWSGYSPNVLGCISVGDTLDEMRTMMTEALEGHLQCMFDDGDALPVSGENTVDFTEETLANGVEHCHVEWLPVKLPTEISPDTHSDLPDEITSEEEAVYADADVYPGAVHSAFTQAGIQLPYESNEKTHHG